MREGTTRASGEGCRIHLRVVRKALNTTSEIGIAFRWRIDGVICASDEKAQISYN